MQLQGLHNEMNFHFFEVNDENVIKIEIPKDEENQEKLKNEWKYITRIIRLQFLNFNNYKYQWYYQFKMTR